MSNSGLDGFDGFEDDLDDEWFGSDRSKPLASPGKSANCIPGGSFSVFGCEDCLSGLLACPCQMDPDYRSYLQYRLGYAERRRQYLEQVAIAAEFLLKEISIALHHEVISQMVQARFPDLNASDSIVYQALLDDKERFRTVRQGVYALVEWG